MSCAGQLFVVLIVGLVTNGVTAESGGARPSTVHFLLETPDFVPIETQEFAVTPIYQQFTFQFDSQSNYDAQFIIQLGSPAINRYCIDNVIMTRVPL